MLREGTALFVSPVMKEMILRPCSGLARNIGVLTPCSGLTTLRGVETMLWGSDADNYVMLWGSDAT
jgi:hypothetical protein